MARKYSFRAPGKSNEPATMPQEPSAISPLPFYPNLRRALRSNVAAVLLVYLELHHPPAQDDKKAPVLVDVGRTRVDLQLGAREFKRALTYVCACFHDATELRSAQRAGREFYRATKHVSGSLKCYSSLPVAKDVIQLRRNFGRIASLLRSVNVSLIPPGQARDTDDAQITPLVDDGLRGSSENCDQNASEIGAVVAQNGRAAALEMARSMAGLSTITDGRRRKGITRSPHNKAAWTPERRARWEATIKAKAEAKCQKTRENTLDGTDGTIGTITNVEW